MGEGTKQTSLGAVILAGGSGRRLGGVDKAALELQGKTLLDHVLDGLPAKTDIVVVGPQRAVSRPVTWCREEPVGGGPLSALATGLAAVDSSLVLLLSCDAPMIAPVLPGLIEAAEHALSVGRDGAGIRVPTGIEAPIPVCVSRAALTRALPETQHNGRLWPVIDGLDLERVAVVEEVTWDIDTPDDLERVRQFLNQSRERS